MSVLRPLAQELHLPAPGGVVALVRRLGDRTPARVLTRSARELLLVAITPQPRLSGRQLRGMVLEFRSRRGRVRLGGGFLQPDATAPEIVRLSTPYVIDVLQERVHERVAVTRLAVLLPGSRRPPIVTYTLDLGGGGCLLDCADEMALGDRVGFEITLGRSEEPVRGRGRIVRVDVHIAGRRALAFETLAEHDRLRIVQFVAEELAAQEAPFAPRAPFAPDGRARSHAAGAVKVTT